MITKYELENLKKVDIKNCSINELVDIREVKVNNDKPMHEKFIDFINQLKNPYLFKVGDIVVKLNFSDNEQTFQKKFENIIVANMEK